MVNVVRVTILFASRRGATRQIVDWMREYFNKHDAFQLDVHDIGDDLSSIDTDLLLVGYPIYFEKPWKHMSAWMEENIQKIKSTYVALFTLGWAKSMYNRVEGHIAKNYFGPIEQHFSDNLISKHMFRGWIRKKDLAQQDECNEWIRDILGLLQSK
ncbi:MAG: flavodoxin family protein [Candidatus Thorarchaeota archaeon]